MLQAFSIDPNPDLFGPSLVIGLANAGIYSVLAVALVLTFKISRTVGFIHYGIAVIGALVGLTLPGLTGAESSSRRALLGALIGVGMALLGLLIFFLLLNGFDGA